MANKLKKVKNTGMRWISGGFSTTPISALELITYTPPLIAQLNIAAFKYTLRMNKLLAIHPVRRLVQTFQFQSINTQRLKITPGPYEKFSVFNMCQSPELVTNERFVYNHKEQIFSKRILDLYDSNIAFVNFDHPKKGTNLFNQWFTSYKMWLNTIRNKSNHLLVSTDGSYKNNTGTAAFAIWINGSLINSDAIQVQAHSAYDAELQAIGLMMDHIQMIPIKKITILIDNESAARSIWRTNYHNLQHVSIKAMMSFCRWTTQWRTKDFQVNVSWCPAYMNIEENELVDSLTNEVTIGEMEEKTMLESEIRRIKELEYRAWDKTMHQHNSLGSGYLRLKYKGKRIGPSLGSRRKAFIEASEDNIKILARLMRLVTNHALIGEYRRRFFPMENRKCNYDNEYQTRLHILTKCEGYQGRFRNLDYLR
ncbi:hypothetical protein AX15_007138 [Amanita polypyramis BW_CC]|nr:hypothetical protein AX15_007138 [Amanita polypyramis BW_CC]